MVYFEDSFWGEKNAGYDVLYHNMKHGLNASRELAEFVRDRVSVEEVYAKSLSKICKPTTASTLGTFEPCWKIIKTSTEILVNSHNQVVQKLQELIKSIKDYGESQKESHKNLKDDINATAEVVNLIQTKTAAVLKAKDAYYARCQEFEKVKKETTNAKDIEKAELKKIRAAEEYKTLVDKREEVRKLFHGRMIETAKKFEELEMSHLKKMSEYLLAYVDALASGQMPIQKVTAHFRTQVEEMTTDKLLAEFVKSNTTGRNVPDEIVFEEFAVTGSLVELEAEESPNINTRAQSISAFRKKRKEKDKERKEKKTKKKKDREKLPTPNGTLAGGPEAGSSDALPEDDNMEPEVDEEGYRIKPKDSESNKSHESISDSDSSDEEDEPKKFQITIKPQAEKTTPTLDEFRSIQLTLPTPPQKKSESSSSDGDFSKMSFSDELTIQSTKKYSKSQEDLLSIDFSQKTFPSLQSKPADTMAGSLDSNQLSIFPPFNSSSPSNGQAGDIDQNEDKPPELAPKKRIGKQSLPDPAGTQSPALPPKKLSSTLSGSTGSLPDQTSLALAAELCDEHKNSPHGSVSLLAPPPSELARITSGGSGGNTSRPRPKGRLSATGAELSSASISLPASKAPTRTYGSSTSAANTTAASTDITSYSTGLLANVTTSSENIAAHAQITSSSPTKTIWDKLNSPSNQRAAIGRDIMAPTVSTSASSGAILQPIVANSLSGQAQVKKHDDIIPVAVALVETVNAYFKGKEASRNIVTGDITVSFPVIAIKSLSAVEDPPVLCFAITGLSSLESVLPNKSLIYSEDPDDGDTTCYKFKMPALLGHLKKLAAAQGQAPYYNIDILKYQVLQSTSLAPLSVSSYWKCDEKSTDVRVDYQYSPSCLSTPSPLSAVSVIVPVNGGVEIVRSKPIASWSKERQKALWQIPEISSNSEGQGSSFLRARFDLKEGPSTPQAIAVQFQCNGSTLSKIDFHLKTDMYKLSLVKRKIVTGKYLADPKLMSTGM